MIMLPWGSRGLVAISIYDEEREISLKDNFANAQSASNSHYSCNVYCKQRRCYL